MKIEVVCFGVMKEYLPDSAQGNRARVDLPDDATVGDAIGKLGAPARLVYAVLVNEDPADVGRKLQEGDQLTLMPQFTGGK